MPRSAGSAPGSPGRAPSRSPSRIVRQPGVHGHQVLRGGNGAGSASPAAGGPGSRCGPGARHPAPVRSRARSVWRRDDVLDVIGPGRAELRGIDRQAITGQGLSHRICAEDFVDVRPDPGQARLASGVGFLGAVAEPQHPLGGVVAVVVDLLDRLGRQRGQRRVGARSAAAGTARTGRPRRSAAGPWSSPKSPFSISTSCRLRNSRSSRKKARSSSVAAAALHLAGVAQQRAGLPQQVERDVAQRDVLLDLRAQVIHSPSRWARISASSPSCSGTRRRRHGGPVLITGSAPRWGRRRRSGAGRPCPSAGSKNGSFSSGLDAVITADGHHPDRDALLPPGVHVAGVAQRHRRVRRVQAADMLVRQAAAGADEDLPQRPVAAHAAAPGLAHVALLSRAWRAYASAASRTQRPSSVRGRRRSIRCALHGPSPLITLLSSAQSMAPKS